MTRLLCEILANYYVDDLVAVCDLGKGMHQFFFSSSYMLDLSNSFQNQKRYQDLEILAESSSP